MFNKDIDTQIKTYESYLLAEDKLEYLESLIPNSQLQNLLKLTHEFASKANISYDSEKKIQNMIKVKALNDDNRRIAIRYLLGQIEKTDNEDYLKDYFETFNSMFLNKTFSHSKPTKFALA